MAEEREGGGKGGKARAKKEGGRNILSFGFVLASAIFIRVFVVVLVVRIVISKDRIDEEWEDSCGVVTRLEQCIRFSKFSESSSKGLELVIMARSRSINVSEFLSLEVVGVSAIKVIRVRVFLSSKNDGGWI